MVKHLFDINLAKVLGVKEAIILENIAFWIRKNKANDKHFHEGKYWTYNSIKAFEELFPYLSNKQIRNTLENLVEKGALIKGNFNKSAYDRTCWYSLGDRYEFLIQNEHFDLPNNETPFALEGEPIPYINTDNKQNIYSSLIKEVVDYLNQKIGSSYKATTEATRKHIRARAEEGFTLEDFKRVIDIKYYEWNGTDMEQFLRPQTLFSTKFESYLNQKTLVDNRPKVDTSAWDWKEI